MATKKTAAKKPAAKAKSPKITSAFTVGDRVVKVLHGAGTKTATVGWRVSEITKDGVRISCDHGDSSLFFDLMTGAEIDPVIPGFRAEIIAVES